MAVKIILELDENVLLQRLLAIVTARTKIEMEQRERNMAASAGGWDAAETAAHENDKNTVRVCQSISRKANHALAVEDSDLPAPGWLPTTMLRDATKADSATHLCELLTGMRAEAEIDLDRAEKVARTFVIRESFDENQKTDPEMAVWGAIISERQWFVKCLRELAYLAARLPRDGDIRRPDDLLQ